METMTTVLDFLSGNSAMLAGVASGLFVMSEALASIPAIQANSVFQLVRALLVRFKPV